MIYRAGQSIVRALQIAPILLLMFSGCTCSEEAPVTSAPQAAAPQQSPTSAAPPTATLAPSTPTAAVPPTEAPPVPDTATQSECESYVNVLSGRSKDVKLLEKPEARPLVSSYPNLIMCGAVVSDSDEMCRKLMRTESGPDNLCRRMVATFHELKAYPKGRSFMFEEVDSEECRNAPFPGAKICDAFRAAMRSADVKECAATGVLQSVCRAYIGLDASLCRLEGTPEPATMPERKQGEGPIDVKKAVEESCRETIGERAPLAAGLEALTSSGQPQLKAFAKAALGQKDACAPLAAEAMQACTSVVPTPAPQVSPPAPQASPPDTPAPIKDLRTPESDTSKTPPAEPLQVS